MKPSHTYELSSLAKSLKKSLSLEQSHAQILEALAKAAGMPSYGHLAAQQEEPQHGEQTITSKMLDGTEPVAAEMHTDDRVVEFEVDGRLFLLTEEPEVVLNSIFCQLFDGGLDAPTDCIAEAACYKEQFSVIQAYTAMPKCHYEGIGFEASIDAESALKFLAAKRPTVLYGYEGQMTSEPRFKDFVIDICAERGSYPGEHTFEDGGPEFCAEILLRLAQEHHDY